jgi:3-hydroxyacyl-CoA dehydrogenase
MAMVSGTIDYSGFASVDFVVEAVFEDLQIKHQVLRETEREIPERAVFATNTSTIPIAAIAQASARPDRVLGMHFFSPVHKMPLLEVIVTPRTDPQAVVTAVSLGRRLGKTVIVVNDGPGFYVNRILSPYLNEAGILLDTGARIEAIDEAMVKFGFPVGPITLLDEVGLDVAAKAGAIMANAFGMRLSPARSFTAVSGAGRYGRKNKSGFYHYDEKGKKGAVDESVYDLTPTGRQRTEFTEEEIRSRLVLAMLNEAVRCAEEGILRSVRDGDIGAVYGIGFPPFRGGPFRYMESVGIAEVARQLDLSRLICSPTWRGTIFLFGKRRNYTGQLRKRNYGKETTEKKLRKRNYGRTNTEQQPRKVTQDQRSSAVAVPLLQFRCCSSAVAVPLSQFRCRSSVVAVPLSQFRCRSSVVSSPTSDSYCLKIAAAAVVMSSSLTASAIFVVVPNTA